MAAAKKYMVPTLEDKCRSILINNLGPYTLWEAYTWSIDHADEQVLKLCQDYITKDAVNAGMALQSTSFVKIPQKTLHDMLQLNHVKTEEGKEASQCGILISEIQLFEACDAWAEAECIRQDIEASGPNKRKVLGECLFAIRFPTVLIDDLRSIVSKTRILTKDEMYDLYEQNYQDPTQESHTKFPTTNQKFLLAVNCFSDKPILQEFSQTHFTELKYSYFSLVTAKRLALSGIWAMYPNISECYENMEILISDRNSSSSRNARLQKGFVHKNNSGIGYMEFDEVLIMPAVSYYIQVEYGLVASPTEEGSTPKIPVSVPLSLDALSEKSLGQQIKTLQEMMVTVDEDDSKNKHIVGLTARFV